MKTSSNLNTFQIGAINAIRDTPNFQKFLLDDFSEYTGKPFNVCYYIGGELRITRIGRTRVLYTVNPQGRIS